MKKRELLLIGVLPMTFLSADVGAVGFALEHQSVSAMGYAFAGGAASAEDASVMFWNPAGMSRLTGSQAVVGLNAIYGSARFSNQGTTSPAGPAFPITGGEGGNPVGLNWVPNLYYATDLSRDVKAGIAINSPFGLRTEYPADWMGRYHAIDSVLKSVNINPAVSWKLREGVSLGGGINFQYLDAELSNAIDYGAACFGVFGPAACAGAGITPQARDGIATVTGDSWGVGWNVGALFDVSRSTRLGIAYRSSVKHELEGRAAFQNPALPGAFAALTAQAQDTGARSTIRMPEKLSLSAHGEIDGKWSVLGDVTWTRWSRFKELRVRFDNGSPDAVTPANWRDTVRVSLGAGYRLDDRFMLRGGIAYENSPIRDEFRTPRIPDSAHRLVAFGLNYKVTKASSIDLGYMHAFVKDAPVSTSTPTAGTLAGTYKVSAEVLSLQYVHNF